MLVNKLTVLFLTALTLVLSTELSYSAAPLSIRLTWSDNPATTQTINWTTDVATRKGTVQYQKASGGTCVSVTVAAPETYQEVNLWSLTLKNLVPDTVYRYRVGDGTAWSPFYTFTTAPDFNGKFKFLVFGDTSNKNMEYSGGLNKWAENLRGAVTRNPDVRFLVNVGDIVDKGQLYQDWSVWLNAAGTIPARIPIMMTVAKDECNWGKNYPPVPSETASPALFSKMWIYPQNGPDPYKGQAYSFEYGNIHIASVPIQPDGYYPDDEKAQDAMLAEIAAWLRADLAATKQPWKIVLMHLDFYTTMSDRSAVKYRRIIQPILDQFKVDIVFDGHVHTVARTFPIKNNVMYDNPSQGTVYYTVGMGQSEPKKDIAKKIWHDFSYDGQIKANYVTVEVNGEKLEIKCFLDDGRLIDDYTIDKANPQLSTRSVLPARYAKTRMVVMGTVASWWNASTAENGYGSFPFKDNDPAKKISDIIPNGEWCFDIQTVAVLINGLWNPVNRTLIYDDLEIKLVFPANTVSTDGLYVSEAGLRAVGFDVRYDETLNLWYIERFRT